MWLIFFIGFLFGLAFNFFLQVKLDLGDYPAGGSQENE